MTAKHACVVTAAALAVVASVIPSLAQHRKAVSQTCKDGTTVTVSAGSSPTTCSLTSSSTICSSAAGSASGGCSGGTATCGTSSGGGSCTITKAIVRSNLGANGTGAQIRTIPTAPKMSTTTNTTSNILTTTKSNGLTEQHVNTLGTTQVHAQH
jgi:hypothetical protein